MNKNLLQVDPCPQNLRSCQYEGSFLGNEWNKLSATFTNLEGDFEAMPNLVVVFFVYFNHPDRKPSTFQILQTVEAFISIARSALEGYSVNTQLPWKSKLKILPR